MPVKTRSRTKASSATVNASESPSIVPSAPIFSGPDASNMPADVFRQVVRKSIETRDGSPLFNNTMEQASIVIQEALLADNVSYIRIISKRLDEDCYGRDYVISAFSNFLANGKLEILVEAETWDPGKKFVWDNHPLIKRLKQTIRGKQKNNVSVKIVPADISKRFNFNCILLDDFGFRFEPDKEVVAAITQFLPANTKDRQAKHLKQLFEKISSHCQRRIL